MRKKIRCIACAGLAAIALWGCGAGNGAGSNTAGQTTAVSVAEPSALTESPAGVDGKLQVSENNDGLILISGGTFEMGIPNLIRRQSAVGGNKNSPRDNQGNCTGD